MLFSLFIFFFVFQFSGDSFYKNSKKNNKKEKTTVLHLSVFTEVVTLRSTVLCLIRCVVVTARKTYSEFPNHDKRKWSR